MSMKSKQFKTRLSAKGQQYVTDAEFDLTGVTVEDLWPAAVASIVIDLQATYRASGQVPAKDSVKVKEFLTAPKVRKQAVVTPERVVAAAAKMAPEQLAAILAQLGALAKPAKGGGKK